MAEAAKVRVGVRVRPLLQRESELGVSQVITHPTEKQVLVDDNAAHRFTYDHVFPVHASQRDLYASTAAQMLQPFLDGYNVTILAYGQTGSGKTYTMGSECGTTDKYDDDRRGLIPRFLYDMFMNLDADVSHRLEATTMASFLEIYGEDVYDLLSDGHAPGNKRVSLQVLEDKNGVFVNGLTQVPVLGWEAALDVLSQGVLNRTTASTLMNTVSSRSHAVFTITLTQSIKDEADPEGDPQTVTSKLTFVDLAGSERLGRTGAEGQRKREGIQINQGLLALGNVVNALGDDRLEKKSVHVPYRQSKLTRLLQDALGGNSQTLFIACVSPAADSVNETVAALHYANRARNIKNKVVKNTDGSKEELRRLRSTAAALQLELVWEHFRLGEGSVNPDAVEAGDPEATGGLAGLGLGPNVQPEEVLGRDDVKAYLKGVQAKVAELVRKQQGQGTPLILGPGLSDADHSPSSIAPCPSPLDTGARATPRRVLCDTRGPSGGSGACVRGGENARDGVNADGGGDSRGTVVGGAAEESFDADEGLENPEEELAVLDQLIEWQRQTGEYGDAAKKEEKRLEETDSQIREKESMLLKVRETLQGYHHMRERFEALVGKMGELEKEKATLIATMNSEAAAAASASSSSGSGAASGRSKASSASAEALRERLKGVESQLVSLGAQKKKQERAVMLLQRESKKCDDLQAGLAQLKRQKVVLQKRQQEAAKRHREYEQRMSREIQAMRKKNNKDLKHMSMMELEVRRQKAAAARKDTQVGRIGDKLKRTEEHLLRLLSLRKQQGAAERARARAGGSARRGAAGTASASRTASSKTGEPATASARAAATAAALAAEASEARVGAAKHMLEEAVKSRIEHAALRQAFAAKIRVYDEHTSSQVSNIGMLRDYRAQLKDIKDSATGAMKVGASRGEAGAENVDPGGSTRSSRRHGRQGAPAGKNGGRQSGSGGGSASGSRSGSIGKGGVSIGDIDTLEGQRQFLEALVQETEKAVDETQEKLETLSGELDDMCRRLGMGDSFQGRSTISKAGVASPGGGSESGDMNVDSPGGTGGILGPREFKALEGLTPAEARRLVTGLVEDMTASGIGDMLRREEAAVKATEMMELRERNRSMKDELFRLSQRYSRRMSQMKVDHTRDMVRLSMLDSVGDSTEDGGSCFGGSLSGILAECTDDDDGATGGPTTPMGISATGAGLSERTAGLGPVAANLFASPVPTRVNARASWGGPRTSPRTGMPPMAPSPISSRDACEASANRRLSGQHMEVVMARQRHLEGAAETEGKRREKVEARNRALTQDLQRERAERQRVQARLVASERGAEGINAESLGDTVAALEGVWSELGVPQEQRLGLMDRVSCGVVREAEKLLGHARDERMSLSAKVGSLREDLHALWAMLGKTDAEEASAMTSLADRPLRRQAEKLSKLVGTASNAVSAGCARRAKLRSAASAAVKVLELGQKDIGSDLHVLLKQSRFDLPRALRDDEEMAAFSLGILGEDGSARLEEENASAVPYFVGTEALEKFEGEVRKLRTMQAEALAGYHEVRDEAREAVLTMDLSADDAFDLCKRSVEEGWVRIGDGNGPRGEELDEDALGYACDLLCSPGTTHVHVSRSRTQHLQMAWLAVTMAMQRRKSTFADAKILVERAHKDFIAAAASPAELEAEASGRSSAASPAAYEAFEEGLSENFHPLSREVLEACEEELMRIREEALDQSAATQGTITKSRAILREAGGIAAEGRASEVPLLTTKPLSSADGAEFGEETGDEGTRTTVKAMERLQPGGNPGAEEWLDEASCAVAESWESTLEALKSLAVDAAMARALDKRVSALEGVRSSDQDICQLAKRMAELQAALDPGRLSKRNKSSTHLLEAEKNRNACQAAYMRALKRLKEQLKTWREACGCGFDPSLLSDVAREALLDLQRAGRTGAKIEHILPHLDNTNATATSEGGSSRSRATSPEIFSKPRLSQDPASFSATPGMPGKGATPTTSASGMMSSATPSSLATPLKTPQALRSVSSLTTAGVGSTGGATAAGVSPPENVGGERDNSGAGSSALTSIANPGLVSSASKGLSSVQSFRGRGGAFGMLLHKVQAGQTPGRVPAPGSGVFDGIDSGAASGESTP